MATSSFTSNVIVDRKSADFLSKILKKENARPNTKGSKKIEYVKKEDIKKFVFK